MDSDPDYVVFIRMLIVIMRVATTMMIMIVMANIFANVYEHCLTAHLNGMMMLMLMSMAVTMMKMMKIVCAGVCEQLSSEAIGGEHFQRPQDLKSANITCTGSDNDGMAMIVI